jgi:excisionase family DNA binding protein
MQATVTPFPTPDALTPPQAAARLQISEKTLIKMAASGQIPSFRAGRLWRFSTAKLERWLNDYEKAA